MRDSSASGTPVRTYPPSSGFSPDSEADTTPQPTRSQTLPNLSALAASPSSFPSTEPRRGTHQRQPTLAEQIRDVAQKMGTSPIRDSEVPSELGTSVSFADVDEDSRDV